MTADIRAAAHDFARFELLPTDFKRSTGVRWVVRDKADEFTADALPDISPPIPVGCDDVIRALKKLRDGSTSPAAVREWANVILCWDAFEVVGARRERVLEYLHEIANPTIFSPLDKARIEQMTLDLEAS